MIRLENLEGGSIFLLSCLNKRLKISFKDGEYFMRISKMCWVILIASFCQLLNWVQAHVEATMIIHVNKDGSGYIYSRVLYNPKEIDENQKILDEEKLKQANYGDGVRFAVAQEVTGKNGWKGYLAKYHFSDIHKLRIFPQSLPRAMIAPEDDEIRLSGWRFELKKRDPIVAEPPPQKEGVISKIKESILKQPSTPDDNNIPQYILTVIPLAEDMGLPEEGGKEEKKPVTPTPTAQEVKEDIALKALQIGRRYTIYVEVEGTILPQRSTAKYLSNVAPNIFVLNDEQFEIMWKDPQIRAEIIREEPNFSGFEDRPGYRTIFTRTRVVFQ